MSTKENDIWEENMREMKDDNRGGIEKRFEQYWKTFVDKNGFPSYPDYEEIFFWFKKELNELKEKVWNLRHQGDNPTNDRLLEQYYLGHTKCLHEVIDILSEYEEEM